MEITGWVILSILFGLPLIGPFLVSVPALKGLHPARELADPDSQFIRLYNFDIHVKTSGQGQRVFVLLHGFGASLYSWNRIMAPLSQFGRVIAFDRPAFGLTERPLKWKGLNPYGSEAQLELLRALLDHFEIQQAILIGNSAGGTIAMQFALKYPERASALILVNPAVYTVGDVPGWISPILATPQMRHLGPLVARQFQSRGVDMLKAAWFDQGLLTEDQMLLYKKPLLVENWDRALWELTLARRKSDLPARLNQLSQPVLVVYGSHDRIVPPSESIRLAGELPGAKLEVIQNAGHVPHEERPDAFMLAVMPFINSLSA